MPRDRKAVVGLVAVGIAVGVVLGHAVAPSDIGLPVARSAVVGEEIGQWAVASEGEGHYLVISPSGRAYSVFRGAGFLRVRASMRLAPEAGEVRP